MTAALKAEMDALKAQMAELQKIVAYIAEKQSYQSLLRGAVESGDGSHAAGSVYYAGHYQNENQLLREEPKTRELEQLLHISTDKVSKILAALGSKPRLDIIITLLQEALTGAEIVERLRMGTTGQLYHHLKALQGAGLVMQDADGRYALPDQRKLPLLLLLSSIAEMLDAGDYLDMAEARGAAGAYLGVGGEKGNDANLLLWAVVENCILEHAAGYATEVHLFLHRNGGATVTDNGRGIPVQAFPGSSKPAVQTVMTDMGRLAKNAPYQAPGAEKGISIAVVNAFSQSLTVEIRKDGYIYRQDYRNGIPHSELEAIGVSAASGTSITFRPDPELFATGFDRGFLQEHIRKLNEAYPELSILLHENKPLTEGPCDVGDD